MWFLNADALCVEDNVTGRYREAVAHYRFHPDVAVSADAYGREGVAELPGGKKVVWRVERGLGELVKSTWHPRFGVAQPCMLLRVRIEGQSARVRFKWR